ncbi:MAG: aspartate carbamoyltransferase catalytic subunit, partial [Gammaproteobacteria bacterium]
MRAAASLESDTARRHLLTLKGMTRERIEALLDMAQGYCSRPGRPVRPEPVLAGRTVANLFFEPSTRTRCSFELAARRLGAEVLNIDIDASSTVKGESLLDTFATLQAMHIDLFVVRHKEGGTPELLARNAEP